MFVHNIELKLEIFKLSIVLARASLARTGRNLAHRPTREYPAAVLTQITASSTRSIPVYLMAAPRTASESGPSECRILPI